MARAAGAACALLLLAAAPGFCDAAPPPYVNAVLLGATGMHCLREICPDTP